MFKEGHMGKTSVKAVNKYIKKTYDRINFVMPQGRKAEIMDCAQRAGVSASEWINDAIVAKLRGNGSVASNYDDIVGIPDLEAYARSAGVSVRDYIIDAVRARMEQQDADFVEDVTREPAED